MYSGVEIDNVLHDLDRERRRHMEESRVLRELARSRDQRANVPAAALPGVTSFWRLSGLLALTSRSAAPCRVEAGV